MARVNRSVILSLAVELQRASGEVEPEQKECPRESLQECRPDVVLGLQAFGVGLKRAVRENPRQHEDEEHEHPCRNGGQPNVAGRPTPSDVPYDIHPSHPADPTTARWHGQKDHRSQSLRAGKPIGRLLPGADLAVPPLATEYSDLQGLLTGATGLEPATSSVTGHLHGHDDWRRSSPNRSICCGFSASAGRKPAFHHGPFWTFAFQGGGHARLGLLDTRLTHPAQTRSGKGIAEGLIIASAPPG